MSFDANFWLGLEKPARYLGLEPGAKSNHRPDLKGRLFSVALAFPDLYEIAHSHLGHKILYHMINSRPGFSAERVYAPWLDLEEKLRREKRPLVSLESAIPLAEFDLIGFSLQYEMGYTNILNMLELAGLNPLAADRPEGSPLVVGGGPGASNPEPLADFFDFFFLGDAEASLLEDFEILKEWRYEKAPKKELFERLAGRSGLYVPSLFEPVYEKGRLIQINPLRKDHSRVTRAVATSLKGAPFPTCQISPLVKPVHDRVVVEIGRGCSRGCRFCQAGFLYRPVRERGAEEVLDLIQKNLDFTGQDEAAFLSLSAGDHSQIETMVRLFMDSHSQSSVSLSLPSLRVKSLSDNLARQIKRVRKTGFTLAPEAGTDRLRAVINKDLTEEDIFQACEIAFRLGWKTLKLYFMAGLPTETEEDLRAIVSLCRRIKRLAKAKINIGLAHFTPKAHTPFQWQPGSPVSLIQSRLSVVREASRQPGLSVRFNDPGVSFIEALLSRGDRRLGRLLSEVHQRGARFEAWSDHFNLSYWTGAIEDLGIKTEEYLREKDLSETLPWDHLFCGVDKDYLIHELNKSLKAETTADCRQIGCQGCGACSDSAKIDLAAPFDRLKTEEAGQLKESSEGDEKADIPTITVQNSQGPNEFTNNTPSVGRKPKGQTKAEPILEYRYLGRFAKDGPMAFLGHLEMIEAFKRSFRRSSLELTISQGFHPHPKLSFLTALPLGVTSLDECLIFSLKNFFWPKDILSKLSLPNGLAVKTLKILDLSEAKPRALASRWLIVSKEPVFIKAPLSSDTRLSYTDQKRGLRDFLLSDYILEASSDDPYRAVLTIKIGQEGTPKPIEAAKSLWSLEPDFQACLIKLATVLDTDPPIKAQALAGPPVQATAGPPINAPKTNLRV
ncbi:MAG: TIGR03960 family B12-binding radical SAM protein [Deltaproteobacteria bacterium]|nr:TIGR03960 family B12-binding radical SAM protein [Deltaproteobacteria bacterium]